MGGRDKNNAEKKNQRLFLAFYLQYAEFALDARHASFVNQEFFVRRVDLEREIEGFSLVRRLLSALIARGLVG